MPKAAIDFLSTNTDPVAMLLEEIRKLDEPSFTREVVIPFLNKVLPGRIEYTHSNTEAGRDIVVFTKDPLQQERVYCIQVKVTALSYGAGPFGIVTATLMTAKREGVTLSDGSTRTPNEVWFINSQTFAENARRQVRSSLEELARNGIRVIAGEEFCDLVQRLAPEIAERLMTPEALSIAEVSRTLFSHSESRAFRMLPEKGIDEFYVTATISPSQADAYLVLDGLLEIEPRPLQVTITPKLALEELAKAKSKPIGEFSLADVLKHLELTAKAKAGLSDGIRRFGLDTNAIIPSGLSVAGLAAAKSLTVVLEFDLEEALERLKRQAAEGIARCPDELTRNTADILDTVNALELLQDFVRFCDTALKQELSVGTRAADPVRRRVRVPHPEHLLALDRRVVIDGPPGCGKTTLMKVAAVRLLEQKYPVRLISCSQIPKNEKSRVLSDLVANYCVIAKGKPVAPAPVLLFDALDEGPAWLPALIRQQTKGTNHVIVSTRTAYLKNAPADFLNLQLTPFTTEERDLFFDRWLAGREDIRRKAQELVKQHPDLDYHTRLPLIATVLVSLLVRDRTPHSRAAVYEQRLQLLLSDWDFYRSVGRVAVDDPSAKHRLLRELAFQMHSKRRRAITTSKIAKVYADALGQKGLAYRFDDMMSDLTMVNAVLVEEAPDTYSFGHLTFQEHLVGEHLHHKMQVREVSTYIGDAWWREALNFWASIRGNIDDLAEELQSRNRMIANARQIGEMAGYAPYTSPGAIEAIRDSVAYMAADEMRDSELPHDDDATV